MGFYVITVSNMNCMKTLYKNGLKQKGAHFRILKHKIVPKLKCR